MSKGLNRGMVIGNLGRDPELRYTTAGKPVANFSVAATTGWSENERTEWFSVVAWGRLAEVCTQYLKRGSRVYVEGYLQTRSWEGSDGAKRSRTELVAQEMVMLDGSGERDAAGDRDVDVGEIPF